MAKSRSSWEPIFLADITLAVALSTICSATKSKRERIARKKMEARQYYKGRNMLYETQSVEEQ